METILRIPATARPGFILLPTDKGRLHIHAADIIRVEAIRNYSKLFFTGGKTLVVAKVLRWFDENLPASDFLRTHRTHLVNKHFIQRYANSKIELATGDLVDVSRRRKTFFLHCLAKKVA